MLTAMECLNLQGAPANVNTANLLRIASVMVIIYYAITDKTEGIIRLNSSKQHHAPELANPLKNYSIAV